MKEKLGWILVPAAIIAIALGFLWFVTRPAHASQQEKVDLCHLTSSQTNPWVVQEVNANEVQSHLDNGDFLYEGQYGIHTKQAKNWCKDHNVTPTVTPTPTINPCDGDCDEVTPTPTPTEEPVQPESVTTPVFNAPLPPTCNDGTTTSVVSNLQVARNGESATVSFFITEGNSANIYYKESSSSTWEHSLTDVQPNSDNYVSVTINGLKTGVDYDFGVQQKVGCGGGQIVTSFVHDDFLTRIFRLTKYVW